MYVHNYKLTQQQININKQTNTNGEWGMMQLFLELGLLLAAARLEIILVAGVRIQLVLVTIIGQQTSLVVPRLWIVRVVHDQRATHLVSLVHARDHLLLAGADRTGEGRTISGVHHTVCADAVAALEELRGGS